MPSIQINGADLFYETFGTLRPGQVPVLVGLLDAGPLQFEGRLREGAAGGRRTPNHEQEEQSGLSRATNDGCEANCHGALFLSALAGPFAVGP